MNKNLLEIVQLSQDIKVYKLGEFEIAIDAERLYINEPKFKEELDGEIIQVQYLPHNKYGVDWELVK